MQMYNYDEKYQAEKLTRTERLILAYYRSLSDEEKTDFEKDVDDFIKKVKEQNGRVKE